MVCPPRTLGWASPVYGSTFFYGGLEADKPGHPDRLVRVGINLDGVHVLDDSKNEVLLSLRYDEFTYNRWAVYASSDWWWQLHHAWV